MPSERTGKKKDKIEVKSVNKDGVGLIIKGKEYFMSFKHFPWLRYLTIGELSTIELRYGEDIVIPALEIELELESLTNPANYPLLDKTLSELRNMPRQNVQDISKTHIVTTGEVTTSIASFGTGWVIALTDQKKELLKDIKDEKPFHNFFRDFSRGTEKKDKPRYNS